MILKYTKSKKRWKKEEQIFHRNNTQTLEEKLNYTVCQYLSTILWSVGCRLSNLSNDFIIYIFCWVIVSSVIIKINTHKMVEWGYTICLKKKQFPTPQWCHQFCCLQSPKHVCLWQEFPQTGKGSQVMKEPHTTRTTKKT